MKNKRLLLFYLFLLVGIVFVIAINTEKKTSHDVSEVLVNISGYQMTLQQAIEGDYFQGSKNPIEDLAFKSDLDEYYHLGENIYLSKDGVDMTLNEVLNSEGRLRGNISSYSGEIIFGHSIEEIYLEINGEIKSLLDAINNFDICIPDCFEKDCGDDGCGGSCGDCQGGYGCRSDGVCIQKYYYTWPHTCKDFCNSMHRNSEGVCFENNKDYSGYVCPECSDKYESCSASNTSLKECDTIKEYNPGGSDWEVLLKGYYCSIATVCICDVEKCEDHACGGSIFPCISDLECSWLKRCIDGICLYN